MARKGSKENPVTTKELEAVAAALVNPKKPFEIIEAHLKDEFCNYVVEITDGPMTGKISSIKGPLIVHKDLREIFAIFNVHLAFIDDVFKHADRRFDFINALHGDELTTLYHVTGFKIIGAEENECIILIGTKYLSGGGRMNLVTPKTPIDENSSYKWKEELRDVAKKARLEVELYEKGKGTPVEEPEEKEDAKQSKMKFSLGGVEGVVSVTHGEVSHDVEFDDAKV